MIRQQTKGFQTQTHAGRVVTPYLLFDVKKGREQKHYKGQK